MFKNNGYAAILILLIVLAIGMMIYFMDIRAIWGPGLQFDKNSNKPENRPWQMEDLLVPENQTVSVPGKRQPELLEPVMINASVQRNNAPRGNLHLLFGKDCRVTADWVSGYEHDKTKYQLESRMKGNIVPSKLYSDPNHNEDPTRLFFIAKGPYTQTAKTHDNLSQTEQGTAYILGWLCPDNSAEGTITITTDQKWSAVYNFHDTDEKSSQTNSLH